MNTKKSVLIADDSPAIRRRLSELLSERSFNVIEAKDGVEAIKKAFKFQPYFIVLDVNMPLISGYQACRFLKFRKESKDIPVMILTALDKPIDQLRGYETGADFYRSKTLSFEKIVDEIEIEISKVDLPLRKSIEITETDILTSINDYLDEKLFQLTLINEITSLSYKVEEIDNIIKECSHFLSNLMDFYCVSFTLMDEDGLNVYIFSHYEYGTYIEDLKNYIEETFPKELVKAINYKIHCGGKEISNDIYDNKEISFIDSTFDKNKGFSSHVISGGVFFCYNKKNEKELEKIGFLINHILLVINNCLLYQRVIDLSTIDELTKLFNRRKIMEILKIELEKSQRYHFDLSIIMADIDYFKKINDKYGHNIGDAVLKKVSSILKNSVRKVDAVGRFGGEEFLIISPQTSPENAKILAERIKKILNNLKIEKVEEQITLSFGITCYRGNQNIDDFINEADMALYESKNKGRNRITVFGGTE